MKPAMLEAYAADAWDIRDMSDMLVSLSAVVLLARPDEELAGSWVSLRARLLRSESWLRKELFTEEDDVDDSRERPSPSSYSNASWSKDRLKDVGSEGRSVGCEG